MRPAVLNRTKSRAVMAQSCKRGSRLSVTQGGWLALEAEVQRLLCAVARDANGHRIDGETVNLSVAGIRAYRR